MTNEWKIGIIIMKTYSDGGLRQPASIGISFANLNSL